MYLVYTLFMTLRYGLRRMFRQPAYRRGRRNSYQLYVEVLEGRSVPTGLASPQFIPVILPHENLLNGTLPDLGHAGLILVSPNGQATYYDFGRYENGGTGVVTVNGEGDGNIRQVALGQIQFDESGNIAPDSLRSGLETLATKSGLYPGDTGMIFTSPFPITNDQYQQMSASVSGIIQAHQTSADPSLGYQVNSNNCLNFVYNVAASGNLIISANQGDGSLVPAIPSVAVGNILEQNGAGWDYFPSTSWFPKSGLGPNFPSSFYQVTPSMESELGGNPPEAIDSALSNLKAAGTIAGAALDSFVWLGAGLDEPSWNETEATTTSNGCTQLTYTSTSSDKITETFGNAISPTTVSFSGPALQNTYQMTLNSNGSDSLSMTSPRGSLLATTTERADYDTSTGTMTDTTSTTQTWQSDGNTTSTWSVVTSNSTLATAQQYDSRGNPIGDPQVAMSQDGQSLSDSQIASKLGSTIGSFFLGNSIASQIIGKTLVSTIASWASDHVTDLGIPWLGDGSSTGAAYPSTVDSFVVNGLRDLAGTAIQNFSSQALGALETAIVAQVEQKLHVSQFEAAALTTVGVSISQQLVDNLAKTGNLADVLDHFDIAQLGAAFESLGSQVIVSQFAPPSNLGESIFASIGEIVGTAIGSSFGPVGSFVGSFAGKILGEAGFDLVDFLTFGHLHFLDKNPKDRQFISFDPKTNEFVYGPEYAVDTNSKLRHGTYDLTNAYLATVNNVISMIGTVDPASLPSLDSNAYFGYFGGSYWLYPGGGLGPIQVDGDGSAAVRIAAEDELLRIRFLPGESDPTLVHVLTAWQISDTNPGTGNALSDLFADLQVGADYSRYLQNTAMINTLIVAAPTSPFAAGWESTLLSMEIIDRHAAETLLNNAQVCASRGDWKGEIYALNLSLQFDAGNSAVFVSLGDAYSQMKDWKDAIYVYNRAIGLDASHATVFVSLGNAYSQTYDWKDAVYVYERALALSPKDASIWVSAGRAQLANNDLTGGAYSLSVGQQMGAVLQPSWFPSAGFADIASFLAGAQLPNGAITLNGLNSPAGTIGGRPYYQINDYFVTQALIGMLSASSVGNVKAVAIAEKYFLWRLANTNADGTIRTFWCYSDGTQAIPSTPPDSDDAFAGSFETAVWQYYLAGGRALFQIPGVRAQLELISSVMLRLQQANGMTVTFLDLPTPTTPQVEFLDDNARVYAGEVATVSIEATVYHDASKASLYSSAATQERTGIMGLYNASAGWFYIAPGIPANFSNWYPGTTPQFSVLECGVVDLHGSIAQRLVNEIDAAWPNWMSRTDCAPLAAIVYKMGDVGRAQAAFSTLARIPFPTIIIAPNKPGVDVAVATVADAGELLTLGVPMANAYSASTSYGQLISIAIKKNVFDLGRTAGLTVSVATSPMNGTAVVQPGGTVLYSPKLGFSGTDVFTYQVTNASGGTSTALVTVTVGHPKIVFTPSSLASGQVGLVYMQNLVVTGGAYPYSFSIVSGSLPPGLSLTRTGKLSGVPSKAGTFTFTVAATDSSTGDGPFTVIQEFTLTISQDLLVFLKKISNII